MIQEKDGQLCQMLESSAIGRPINVCWVWWFYRELICLVYCLISDAFQAHGKHPISGTNCYLSSSDPAGDCLVEESVEPADSS